MMSTLLTLEEVAQRTRVPASTLRYWRHKGDYGPPSTRIGRRVVYRESDLEAWIAEQFEHDGQAS